MILSKTRQNIYVAYGINKIILHSKRNYTTYAIVMVVNYERYPVTKIDRLTLTLKFVII